MPLLPGWFLFVYKRERLLETSFPLSLLASGYRQHMRARALHVDAQTLGTHERRGISFDEPYAFS